MSSAPGYFKQLYFKWRSLRLPWRRQFLVGADLAGHTYWEFQDALNAGRFRRIVKYSRKTQYADIKIPPQWHQWLRHTRDQAPSIQEQQYDVSRQAMMKQLAAAADERWRSKASFLDAPATTQQPQPPIGVNDPGGYASQSEPEDKQGVRSAVEGQEKVQVASKGMPEGGERFRGVTKEKEEDPWQRRQRGGPGEDWQPKAWTPGVAQRQ